MATSSLVERVKDFLERNPEGKFTSREIARALIAKYPDIYERKKEKGGFSDDKLIAQVAAEISARKNDLKDNNVTWIESPRPQRYYIKTEDKEEFPEYAHLPVASSGVILYDEHELYNPFIKYLNEILGLIGTRIDENKSTKKRGNGGNEWLHPDIVAMECIDKTWVPEVRDCLNSNASGRINLWSFELKTGLDTSNYRKAFFQTVSNSSWANEGYLVAPSVSEDIKDDLKILSGLHGIGIMTIEITQNEDGDMEVDPENSEILFPARHKREVDWQSVNRLASVDNSDFTTFLKMVNAYRKSGSDVDLFKDK